MPSDIPDLGSDPLTNQPRSETSRPLESTSPGASNLPPSPPKQSSISLEKVAEGEALSLRERVINDPREDARRGIAYTIVLVFSGTILFSFVLFLFRGNGTADDVIKLVQAVISPVVAITGTVTGFYFSSSSLADKADRNDNASKKDSTDSAK